MKLHLSTWQDIDRYLETSDAIVIPIGSTEQHGPNGLLGTDAICPEVIALAASDKTQMLVAPTFSVGSAQHHLAFAGTITLRPSTMIAAMVDWTRSLTRHGFRKFYWINGHGGNVPTINAAFAEIYAERSFDQRPDGNHSDLVLRTRNWWELDAVMGLCRQLFPTGDGMHATASEVSVTYAAHPEAVRTVEMSPKIAPIGPIRDAEDYRRRFPDGRIGSDPSQASVEKGQALIEAAATALARDFEAFSRS